MDFVTVLNEKAKECDICLNKYFVETKVGGTALFESMNYSIMSGGKRLRMIVLLESAKLFSDYTDDCIPFACAVEMIHTYSLIHDDLPAMDDAEYRRGRLCNHKLYGECMAILSGDGLLHYAFETMSDAAVRFGSEKAYLYLKAINDIAHFSGVKGMVLGQAIDTQINEKNDLDLLKYIYEKKTASMFIAPMRAGACIAGATEEQIATAASFAHSLGMAFQIADDILDETGNFDDLGKKTGNDKDNNKTTISSLLGIEKAYALAQDYILSAKNDIKPFDRFNFFSKLCDYVINRKS